jgi:hypothetical protein
MPSKIYLACVDQGLQFPTEFDINLAGADINHDALSELLMFDAVADGEALLHRIGPRRAGWFDGGCGILLRPPRGRAAGRGSGGSFALAVDVVATASETFHARDPAFIVKRGDDVLAIQFAFSATGFNVAAQLWTIDNTEWLVGHQIYF